MTNAPAPLTPPDCDLRDFAFMPVDIARLLGSEFHSAVSDAGWRAGFTLWFRSWQQVPAASLPADDVSLARLAEFGRNTRSWKKVRAEALHGWKLCSDGRLYHRVVAEKALEAWLGKLIQRRSSGTGHAARWGTDFDPTRIEGQIHTALQLLAAIAPQSAALAKTHRRLSPRSNDRGRA